MITVTDWRDLEQAHRQRADRLTVAHRDRARTGTPHPVEDFLFTYYRIRPAELRRWFPGHSVVLADAPERRDWRFHRVVGAGPRVDVQVDLAAFLADRGRTVEFVRDLVQRTAGRPAQFGCFGLHEWAMVYAQDDRRHAAWPLRLGLDGTDDVVRGHQLRCSHFDAFRFFTPAARPLNLLQPTLDDRPRNEQPGCLHAGMDLYKWAGKLLPVVSSDLVLDCFELARDIRELDMRASPYDLSELGYSPVPIETPHGKAEYIAAQRLFSDRAQQLRARLLAALRV